MITTSGITRAVYSVFGAGGVLGGLVALVQPSTLAGQTASADQLHLAQELGCAAVLGRLSFPLLYPRAGTYRALPPHGLLRTPGARSLGRVLGVIGLC